MPAKTLQQLDALKKGYLVYRELMRVLRIRPAGQRMNLVKPLSQTYRVTGLTAKQVAAGMAIESKLAVRGVPKESLPTAAEDIYAELFGSGKRVPPNKMIDLAKVGQTVENEAKARAALDNFLGKAKDAGGAIDLKEELELLAGFLVSKSPGAKWISGPLKKVDRAMGKTEESYGWAWGDNKDLVRGTLACDSQATLQAVTKLIKETCLHAFAMELIKKEQQGPRRDGGESDTGYSGWNFVVVFREHPFGAEIQANTYELMYGKMSKKDFCEQLRISEAGYLARQHALKFPGGLGHALYEIQDSRTRAWPEEADAARTIACAYNDGCRGKFFDGWTVPKLNTAIMGFAATLKSVKAKKIWKHASAESGWGPLKDQAIPKRWA